MAEAARPASGMVGVQMLFSVLNILIKLALNDGMDARVLVAYRFMFATVVLCPIAFFVERYASYFLLPQSERDVTSSPTVRSCMREYGNANVALVG